MIDKKISSYKRLNSVCEIVNCEDSHRWKINLQILLNQKII